jgi:hypothetical protein
LALLTPFKGSPCQKNARKPLASVDANVQKAQNTQDSENSLKAWNTSILLGRPNYYGGRKIYMVRTAWILQGEEKQDLIVSRLPTWKGNYFEMKNLVPRSLARRGLVNLGRSQHR